MNNHTGSADTIRYEITGGGTRDPYTLHLDPQEFAQFSEKCDAGELDSETYANARITATCLTLQDDENGNQFWHRSFVWNI